MKDLRRIRNQGRQEGEKGDCSKGWGRGRYKWTSVLCQAGSGYTKSFHVQFMDFQKANQKKINLLHNLVKRGLLAHSHLEK